MDFKQKSEEEIIIDFLTLDERKLEKSPKYYSSFCANLEEDTRLITGRINRNVGSSGSWLGLCGYLILMDMIGDNLITKNTTEKNDYPNFVRGLVLFGNLAELEACALYALRCSLLHGYGLVNYHYQDNKRHFFRLSQENNAQMIVLPEEKWDGNLENMKNNNVTIVNIDLVGGFVEKIIAELKEMANKNELKIALTGGKDEMIKKYFLKIVQ